MSTPKWKEVEEPLVTLGGDQIYECPICKSKESRHVYGVEHTENYTLKCPNCGVRLIYPWQQDDKRRGPIAPMSFHAFFRDEHPSEELKRKVIPKLGEDYDTRNKRFLYGLYQLDWMAKNEYTPEDLIEEVDFYAFDRKYGTTGPVGYSYEVKKMYEDWQKNSGFGREGELWISIDQFLETHFLDGTYIKRLIGLIEDSEKAAYLLDWYQRIIEKQEETNDGR